MTKLDIVNDILRAMGLRSVDTLDTARADVNEAIRAADAALRSVLSRGWWFNTASVTLQPDVSGNIYVPASVIALTTKQPVNGVIRGQRLFNLSAGTFAWTGAVDARVRYTVEVEDMPPSVASLVSLRAQVDTQIGLDGDSTKTRQLTEQLRRAEIDAVADDTHARRFNINNDSYAVSRILAAVGGYTL